VKRYKDDKDEIFPLSLIFFRLNFAWGYLGAESYFGCLALLQNLDRYKILFLAFLKLHEMSSERTFRQRDKSYGVRRIRCDESRGLL